MKPLVSLREALSDPELLGTALPGDSWAVWRALLIAAMGEALTDDERALFSKVTGREREPLERVDEFWAVVGRRGGKTRAAGTLGAYLAALCDWSEILAPGERGVLPVLAASTTQADRAFQHVEGVLRHSPVLASMIDGVPTADTIRLVNGIDVQIRPANFRTIRSITSIAAIGDEIAFWSVENSVNPDDEILNALRPSLATTQGPLIIISSPHSRRGELWKTYRRHFGPNGDPLVLVANGPSLTFNSTLPQRVIDRAYERDEAVARAEYGGEFRDDIVAYVSRAIVEGCVSTGITERLRINGVRYFAFVDPSGGSNDSMTLAVAHREGDMILLDAIREKKPPFSPEETVTEFALVLARYGVREVTGDRYAGEWPREQFRKHGVTYVVSERVRSDLYRDMLPILNSGTASLLDSERLVSQIAGLERRVARGGRESIDHAPGGHDDLANAVAGVICRCIDGARVARAAIVETGFY